MRTTQHPAGRRLGPGASPLPVVLLGLLLLVAALPSEAQLVRRVEPLNRPVSSRAAVAEAVAEIEPGTLAASSAALAIELPDGSVVTARRSHGYRRSAQDGMWRGRIVAQEGGEVFLTERRGKVAGLIYVGPRVYEVIPGAQAHRIVELDPSLFPECRGGVEPPLPAQGPVALHAPASTATDPAEAIDVMVLYTPQARDGNGGVAAVEATIQSAVDITNEAWSNSQVTPRMRLVHTGLANYDDSGNSSADLSWVANDPGVAALRDLHGADMVALIVDSTDACGRGYIQRFPGPSFAPFAFQVTARFCAVGNLSFAHEFGHNQGCEHNPENSTANPASASYPHSFGHYHDGNYRTVMSYSSQCAFGCSRKPYFSNSAVGVGGLPAGVPGQRENYRTLNDTASIVANFRASQDHVFRDGFESGDVTGWSDP